MVGANAVVIANNMRNDPSGLTAFAVGLGFVIAVVVIVALEIRRRRKEQRRKK